MPQRAFVIISLFGVLALAACETPNPCSVGRYDPGPPRRCILPDGGEIGLDDTGPRPDAYADDGSVPRDAFVDPAAPSAPSVAIDPATPRTLDDLSARVVTESIDPMGRSLSYEYRWLRDSTAVAGETAPTLDHALTAKHQTWRLEVVAVTDDGRRSPPGTAMVEIQNTPPVLTTVGLSDYRPIAGESLVALPGARFDDDGDPIAIRYEWAVDGAAAGTTGPRLDALVAGSRVRVVARPSDGEVDGDMRDAGDALVRGAGTHWRQISPTRVPQGGRWTAHDPGHRRTLYFHQPTGGAPQLWERAWDEAGRFIQLRPSGDAPNLAAPSIVYDSANRRLLLWGGYDHDAGSLSTRLYSLSLSDRGREAWAEVTPISEAPSPRFGSAFAIDAETGRAWLVGGSAAGTGTALLGDVWVLDTTLGLESWSRASASTAGVFGATLIIDSVRRRALLLGGARDVGGMLTVTTAIESLALDDATPFFGELASRLPSPVYGAAGAFDGSHDRYVIAHGVSASASVGPTVAIDAESLVVEAHDPDPALPLAIGASMVWDELGARSLTAPAPLYSDGSSRVDLFALGDDLATWTFVEVAGVTAPLDRTEAAFAPLGSALLLFGGLSTAGTLDDAWSVAPRGSGARRLPMGPLGRWHGAVAARDLVVFGGRDDSGLIAPTVTELISDSWIEWEVTGGAPRTREGGVAATGGCAGLVVFGGRDAAGALASGTQLLTCASERSGCVWTVPSITSPPPRDSLASATVGSRPVVHGGRSASAPLSDMWAFNGCTAGWQSMTQSGPSPGPREGHTLTATDTNAALLFGGSDASIFRVAIAGNTATWSRVTTDSSDAPAPRTGHAAAYDSARRRLYIFGGLVGAHRSGDLWELVLP